MSKPALGRGLGALLGDTPVVHKGTPLPAQTLSATSPTPASDSRERVQRVPLARIRPCPLQPRKDFPAESLRELADSIKEQGIVQPLIVRDCGAHLELIAGERRWRAAQLLNLIEVPVIMRQADDRAVLELALIENLQRENLNPIEEARGYSQLIEQFHLTQEEAAAKVGKNRASVANALRLLRLGPELQGYIRDGRLSVGHGKVLLSLTNENLQTLAAERVIKDSLNVRQTEGLVARLQSRNGARHGKHADARAVTTQDPHVANLEEHLRERLGTKVHLRYAHGKGTLEVSFFNDDELQRILEILGITPD